jgi:hypothetical protein
MVRRTPAELEHMAQDLALTLDRRSGRLPEEFVTALKGRMDELMQGAATLRYEDEKRDRDGGSDGPSGGL